MTEATVELNVEGTGPKVSTLKVTSPTPVDASGNAVADTAKHQQVVTLADKRGDLTSPSDAILAALREIRDVLVTISGQLE